MTTSRNEHTNDLIKSKVTSNDYRDNYDRIFGKKPVVSEQNKETPDQKPSVNDL
jgi:hypothetical protein